MNALVWILGLVVFAELMLLVVLILDMSGPDEELTPRIKQLMTASFIQGWRRAYHGQPRGNWTPELARASVDIGGMNREEAPHHSSIERRGWREDCL